MEHLKFPGGEIGYPEKALTNPFRFFVPPLPLAEFAVGTVGALLPHLVAVGIEIH
ncbi:hypothetical protein [Streptomyces sp. DSM 40907]|uniref:hypothetical protein n=1 Tax=Streptomyces kutzneri TaxID=3051179 RepID=UPI0028D3959E|nr:hypothetical protein [Streptomyces sp. DSM 40907]